LRSQQFNEAVLVYANNPMALHLRGMNMLYEVMKAGGTSTVVVPSSAVQSMNFGTIAGITAVAQAEAPRE
jgi:regulator of protease activity HflC (stomatin/prohibitin superfamily)